MQDKTFTRFASFYWQCVFMFTLLVFFSCFATWSILSMTQRAEEKFRLEALTNCKVLEVAIADTISQHLGYAGIQSRIEDLIENDHRIVRLSFIARAQDNAYYHVASSLDSRIGKPAHKEDLEVIASGEVVILEEDYADVGALDITYPVHGPDENIIGLIGYTVSRGEASKEPVILVFAAILVILLLFFNFVYHLRRSFNEIKRHQATEQALRDIDRMKNQFISTAAHELRTPLSSVLGFAELLLNPETINGIDKEKQREFLEIIFTKTEALCMIIDDLLDVSRIESGSQIPLKKQPCNIGEIIQKEVDNFRIHSPGNPFELSLTESNGAEIWADRNKIMQVLENLFSNAIKYSADGESTCVTGGETDNGYRFTVTDKGIGMTPEQIEHVYDKFYRADYNNTAVGGLGLGMNIVHHIIESHGGNIQVASEPGRGTVVTVDLPFGKPKQFIP